MTNIQEEVGMIENRADRINRFEEKYNCSERLKKRSVKSICIATMLIILGIILIIIL
jgi:hypothetical protein